LHVEAQFNIGELIRVIIPKTTLELLKIQKSPNSSLKVKKQSKSPLNVKDANFSVQQCQYYTFQLVCKDKTMEYVVEGYLPFKYITAAFEDLISQRDSTDKISKRIFIYEEQPSLVQPVEEEEA
jgi:hypothetical protein